MKLTCKIVKFYLIADYDEKLKYEIPKKNDQIASNLNKIVFFLILKFVGKKK